MKKIILFKEKKDCCGCGACFSACPKKTIEMVEDEFGFKYPQINYNNCISCGICNEVCGYQSSQEGNFTQKTYIAALKSKEILKSSSGGAFFGLAYNILKEGGVIYGAAFKITKDNFKLEHTRVDSKEELELLQGSKYLQSNMENTFQKILSDLNSNKKVLFSGTPCQIDALYHYLRGKKYENLMTVEIICHGVPSESWFQNYIYVLARKYKGIPLNFFFRIKDKGWGSFYAKFEYLKDNQKKDIYFSSVKSSYYYLFLTSLIYRESCYYCKYASSKRFADITIGDYWGIEIEHPSSLLVNGGNYNLKEGISCILVNTDKGDQILKKYGTNLELKSSSFEKVAAHNKQLKAPSKTDFLLRNKILYLYKKSGYMGIEKWYNRKFLFKLYMLKIVKKIYKILKRIKKSKLFEC